jgi:ribonuclease III
MDTPVYNPYNPRNRMFTQKDIHSILYKHSCQHSIKNVKTFQNAMVHSSYVTREQYTTPQGDDAKLAECPDGCLKLFPESYERLEHLGDSILGAAVATYLSIRFPTQQEGFLTNLRKEIVCNNMLGDLTRKIKLNEFYIISKHNEEACNGRYNVKKLGDILEAFIGALWIDSEYNFQVVYSFVVSLIETYIDIPGILRNDTNYKDQLQKYCQTKFHYTPTYVMLSSNGEYTMAATDSKGKQLGVGTGTTKKQGEQLAAQDALQKLKTEFIKS